MGICSENEGIKNKKPKSDSKNNSSNKISYKFENMRVIDLLTSTEKKPTGIIDLRSNTEKMQKKSPVNHYKSHWRVMHRKYLLFLRKDCHRIL